MFSVYSSNARDLRGNEMKYRHFTALHTDFDATECLRRLNESIDVEQRTIFSFSGYKGSKPVLGRIDGYQFYLRKRRYWRNDFAPQFYGDLVVQERGTVVEGYFDLTPWTRKFMRIWLGGVILLGAPIFILSVVDLIHGSRGTNPAVGLLVPIGLVSFGTLLPKFGLLIGNSEEKFIVEFLQRALVARIAAPSSNPIARE
jgi:hypothetical protein